MHCLLGDCFIPAAAIAAVAAAALAEQQLLPLLWLLILEGLALARLLCAQLKYWALAQ